MRIAFDVTSCAKNKGVGIAGYGRALIAACHRIAPQYEYVLGVRPNRLTKKRFVADIIPGTTARVILDWLPSLTLGSLDIFHGIGVRLPPTGSFAKICTIHDLNVFEDPDLSTAEWVRIRQEKIRQTVKRADFIISYSEQGAKSLEQYLNVPQDRIRVIPAGVDANQFARPDEERINNVKENFGLLGRPYILAMGRFGPRKNQIALLQAFANATLPDDWLLVFGGPDGENATELLEAASDVGIKETQICLPGWVSHADYPALLAGSSIYACPSLHEGFGLPVLEAQAAGVPVVSSNRGALPETTGDVGLVVDPADSEAFSDALTQLAEDRTLAEDFAKRGPRRVREQFTWERVATDTLALYTEAVPAS